MSRSEELAKELILKIYGKDAECHYGFELSIVDLLEQVRNETIDKCLKICSDMQGGFASDDHLECAIAIKKLRSDNE